MERFLKTSSKVAVVIGSFVVVVGTVGLLFCSVAALKGPSERMYALDLIGPALGLFGGGTITMLSVGTVYLLSRIVENIE